MQVHCLHGVENTSLSCSVDCKRLSLRTLHHNILFSIDPPLMPESVASPGPVIVSQLFLSVSRVWGPGVRGSVKGRFQRERFLLSTLAGSGFHDPKKTLLGGIVQRLRKLATAGAGLRITDARRFVGWAAGGGGPPAAPSDEEDEVGRAGTSSQPPQLSTPEARCDSRPEPSTSGTRRCAALCAPMPLYCALQRLGLRTPQTDPESGGQPPQTKLVHWRTDRL